METKQTIKPCTCLSHDQKERRLNIEVQIPGVEKRDISLDMRKDSFCLSAPRGEDVEYSGCFMLSHSVDPEKAQATYENGLLRIFAPIKDWEHRVNLSIH